jgi:hypothetical protein
MLPFLSPECLEAMLGLFCRRAVSQKQMFATDLPGKIALTSDAEITQEAAVQDAPAKALE